MKAERKAARAGWLLLLASIAVMAASLTACPGQASGKKTGGWAANDLERDGLAGRVKYMKVEVAKVSKEGGELKEYGSYLSEERLFNEAGWLTERTSYGEDGSVQTRISAAFDPSGRKTLETITAGSGKEMGKIVYSYDDQGRRTSIENYLEGELFQKTEYIRDPSKPQVRVSKYAKGKKISETLRTYDADFHLLSSKESEDDKPAREVAYEYDAAFRVVLETSYAPDGSPQAKKEYAYDDKGRVVRLKSYYPYSVVSSRMDYGYPGGGAMNFVENYDVEGRLLQRLEYDEDDRGNRLRAVGYRASPDGTELVPAELTKASYIYY